ncbi:hypothetical protein NP233_g5064 [Leucocoprinus birnbaumii]|uniref:F-box domain-containing protein n=1 Tax=Leucocoprinus birnbaumii TaxID=56174 RepID=A0AAD5VZV6_9AGAR|nr:hypothetical protein NP233_g5064 [Leucocoprinus birnbaumii]
MYTPTPPQPTEVIQLVKGWLKRRDCIPAFSPTTSALSSYSINVLVSITPPRSLPVFPYDILSTIFRFYLAVILQEHPNRPPRPCTRYGPLLLSHVCQHWRDVALSTPILWSTLTIEHDVTYDIILHYLSLARESHLCLYISQWSYCLGKPDNRVLGLLLSRANKWRSVRILFDEETAKDFLRLVDGQSELTQTTSFEMLEEATIEGSVLVSVETSMKLWSALLNRDRFPSLRRLNWSLELKSAAGSAASGIWDADLKGLTFLALDFPPPMTDCLRLLQECTDLQIFDADFRSFYGTIIDTHSLRALQNHDLARVKLSCSSCQLTFRVDGPLQERRISRFLESHLSPDNCIVDVHS